MSNQQMSPAAVRDRKAVQALTPEEVQRETLLALRDIRTSTHTAAVVLVLFAIVNGILFIVALATIHDAVSSPF
jgi:hypothetical protein